MALTALFSAATGMQAQQTNIDVIANNIANVNTTAFKAAHANFQDLLYQRITPAGTVDASSNRIPVETAVGLGVQLVNTQLDFSQGRMQPTTSKLDVAIQGGGFFQVQLPNDVGRGGYGYSRDGNFIVDADGQLVTSQGYKVIPNIAVPNDYTDIVIASDGTVSVETAASSTPQQIGTIQLASFVNPSGMESIGQNLYLETPASGTPTVGNPGTGPAGQLSQGYLESSNVELVNELVSMIRAQRAFEFNSQSIKTADEMLKVVASLRG